jgi:hypothetical protein
MRMNNMLRPTQPPGGCFSSYPTCRRSCVSARLSQRRSTVLSSTAMGAVPATRAAAPAVVRNNIQVGIGSYNVHVYAGSLAGGAARAAATSRMFAAFTACALGAVAQLASCRRNILDISAIIVSACGPAATPHLDNSTPRAAAALLHHLRPRQSPPLTPALLILCPQFTEVTVAGPPGPATTFMIPDPLVYEAVMVRRG